MTTIPAQPGTKLIRHEHAPHDTVPVIGWNVTAQGTRPVTAHMIPLALVWGDIIEFPDETVLDLGANEVYESRESWLVRTDHATHGKPILGQHVSVRPAPAQPVSTGPAPRPAPKKTGKAVGPFDITFGGKRYQRWSNWWIALPDGDIVFELPPNTASPTSEFVTRVNREVVADKVACGADKLTYDMVRGAEPLPNADETKPQNEDEDEDDLSLV